MAFKAREQSPHPHKRRDEDGPPGSVVGIVRCWSKRLTDVYSNGLCADVWNPSRDGSGSPNSNRMSIPVDVEIRKLLDPFTEVYPATASASTLSRSKSPHRPCWQHATGLLPVTGPHLRYALVCALPPGGLSSRIESWNLWTFNKVCCE